MFLNETHEKSRHVKTVSWKASLHVIDNEPGPRFSDILDEHVDGALWIALRLGSAVQYGNSHDAMLYNYDI